VTSWITIPVEWTRLYSPIGLRLLDELTNQPPLGNVHSDLDILDAANNWQPTNTRAVLTPGGVLTYPGLGRHAVLTGQVPQKYRARITADLYLPHYLTASDGIEFTVPPYNDDNPPSVIVEMAVDTPLLPAPDYPFSNHVPVLRGVVVDGANNAVPYAYVTQSNKERSLTDSRGTFALPLRWIPANTLVSIDAADRGGRTGTISVQFPDALNKSQTISIS